ncbi:MAG: protein translocase subunit SecF [Planctomycetes bacterium]|nr:protein translocase subunit SecF [Planctomycetota bacterium]
MLLADGVVEELGDMAVDAVPLAEDGSVVEPFNPQRNNTPYSSWQVEIEGAPDQVQSKLAAMKKHLDSAPYFPSSTTIGGKVAKSTQLDAIFALLASLIFIVGYIWVRFQRVVFGLAAVVALVHDVLITLGLIALSAYVAGFLGFLGIDEFKISLSIVAAFLTIIGYSLNDTIVVFDRIREVRGKSPKLTGEIVNKSINQTLSRTVLTSLTTLIVVVILFFFGGQGIHGFAFALVVGVMVGTYSSIFVASPVLLWLSSSPESTAQPGNKLNR